MEPKVLKSIIFDLVDFLDSVDNCPECVAPGEAYDGEHAKEWKRLKKRLTSIHKQLTAN